MARDISIPNYLYSDEEFSRYYHYDLDDMTSEELLIELTGRRWQLWLLKSGCFGYLSPFERGRRVQWLLERISRIQAELGKRRYSVQETRSQPKPKLAEGVRL